MCHSGGEVGNPQRGDQTRCGLLHARDSVCLLPKMGASGRAGDRLRGDLAVAELREQILYVKAH